MAHCKAMKCSFKLTCVTACISCSMRLTKWEPLPLTVSCFSKIQIGFTFLVPAHQGSPRERAVKRVHVSG